MNFHSYISAILTRGLKTRFHGLSAQAIRLCAMTLLTLCASPRAHAAMPPTQWIIHPALDINSYLYPTVSEATNNIQRLAESDRYLYAAVTGSLYQEQTDKPWYRNAPIVAARYDKLSSDPVMTPLATILPVSGINVEAMEYDQNAKCLALAYDNRTIDLIFDDGRLLSNTDLRHITRPGGAQVRSLQFDIDARRLTAATDFGILVIDTSTGHTLSLINLNTPILCANIVGADIIAADAKGLRRFPLDTPPARFADLPLLSSTSELSEERLLSADGTLRHLYGIYPMTPDSFLFIGPNIHSESAGCSLNLMQLPAYENNSLSDADTDSDSDSDPAAPSVAAPARALSLWSSAILFDQMGLRADCEKFPRESALLSPTADGFMIHSHSGVFLIDTRPLRNGSVDISNLKKSVSALIRSITKPTPASPNPMTGREAYKQLTTYDGRRFHLFSPRQGFQPRDLDLSSDTPQWSDAGDIIRMNAPLAGLPSHIYYNPKHGMIVHNQGRNTANTTLVNNLTDGLSVYSGGRWQQISAASLNPACYFNGNDALMWSPAGGVHDPLDPDQIYVFTRTMGMRRQNLSDPQDILIFTRSNYVSSHPARIPIEDAQTGSTWSPLCSLGFPDFDRDGTMWTSYARIPSTAYPEVQAELWYWPAADRAAVKSPSDYAAHPFRRLVIPGFRMSQLARIHTPASPQNRNIVAVMATSSEYPSFFYDHNGTPEDTTDDRIRFLENALDENGERYLEFTHPNLFMEDPYDGAFLVSTVDGLIALSRDGIFNQGDDVHFQWVEPLTPSGGLAREFGAGQLTGITSDAEGRKWLTTSTGTLVCLSADRTRILAEYGKEDSPLPSANLLSVAYNPAANSIFVGTDCGIAEILLGGSGSPVAEPKAQATPSVVEPGYRGYVIFSGLLDSRRYSLIDESGKEVLPLPAPADGLIQVEAGSLPHGLLRLAGPDGSPLAEVTVL